MVEFIGFLGWDFFYIDYKILRNNKIKIKKKFVFCLEFNFVELLLLFIFVVYIFFLFNFIWKNFFKYI